VATVTSRLPALIDYLVTLFQNATALGGPVVNGAQTGPVTVYDGPATTGLDAPLKLFVGLSDPDNPAADPAGDFTQEWAGLGRLARNETSTVHCCAEAWAGTDDLKTVRVSVTGIVAAVETLLQADSTQFGGNVQFPAPGVTTGALLQNNSDRGAIARIAFDLTFKSRIGG
jgi:hypothetical protein